jgi:AsmA protein
MTRSIHMAKMRKMNKGIKIAGIVVLSIVAFIMAAAFILPYVITLDKYKGIIEEKMEQALKRDVSLGKLRLSILPTLGAKIENLVISNPPGFSQTPLLSLDALKVRVKIIPLLFGRKEIAGLTLNHPVIFIEKDQKGKTNIPYMEETGKTERKGRLESGTVRTEKSKALQGLALNQASLRKGKFIYLDRSTIPAQELVIEDIDLDIKDLALDKKIQYKLSLQWSPGKIVLDGWVGPFGETIDLTNIPLQGRLQADLPDLAVLMKKLSAGGEGPLAGGVKADVRFTGHKGSSLKTQGEIALNDLSIAQTIRIKGPLALTGDLSQSSHGTPSLSVDINSPHLDVTLVEKKKGTSREAPSSEKKPATKKQGTKGGGLEGQAKVIVKEGTFQGSDFHDFLLAAEMKGGEIRITRFSCAVFKGQMEGDGVLNTAHEPSPFRMKAKITGVDLDAVLTALASSKGTMKGRLNGDVDLSGAGFSLDTLKKNLTGTGTVAVKEGELTWLDLINRIVGAVGGKIGGKEKTTFDNLHTSFTVKNGVVTLPDMLMSQKDTALKLRGDVGLDSTLKMEGEAHLPASTTGDLSGKGWRFLTDDQGRLTIPFTLHGALKDPKVGISTKLIEQGVKGVLEEFLQKKKKK